ncbi:transposase [Nitrosospira sp. Nl5]|uniref:transposase n=1 Tax=Nitrosospira sp. Nl5 TaxID=200120 RepID=UPI000A9703C2|nr:transposase [Nitrosospira sp. Nl5]
MGFKKVIAEATGRPPYAAGDLLKLYVYGYLNRVRSSRMIERETRRNIEVMWLVNRVSPTYKTIADFRRDHSQAICGRMPGIHWLLPRAAVVWRRTAGY